MFTRTTLLFVTAPLLFVACDDAPNEAPSVQSTSQGQIGVEPTWAQPEVAELEPLVLLEPNLYAEVGLPLEGDASADGQRPAPANEGEACGQDTTRARRVGCREGLVCALLLHLNADVGGVCVAEVSVEALLEDPSEFEGHPLLVRGTIDTPLTCAQPSCVPGAECCATCYGEQRLFGDHADQGVALVGGGAPLACSREQCAPSVECSTPNGADLCVIGEVVPGDTELQLEVRFIVHCPE